VHTLRLRTRHMHTHFIHTYTPACCLFYMPATTVLLPFAAHIYCAFAHITTSVILCILGLHIPSWFGLHTTHAPLPATCLYTPPPLLPGFYLLLVHAAHHLLPPPGFYMFLRSHILPCHHLHTCHTLYTHTHTTPLGYTHSPCSSAHTVIPHSPATHYTLDLLHTLGSAFTYMGYTVHTLLHIHSWILPLLLTFPLSVLCLTTCTFLYLLQLFLCLDSAPHHHTHLSVHTLHSSGLPHAFTFCHSSTLCLLVPPWIHCPHFGSVLQHHHTHHTTSPTTYSSLPTCSLLFITYLWVLVHHAHHYHTPLPFGSVYRFWFYLDYLCPYSSAACHNTTYYTFPSTFPLPIPLVLLVDVPPYHTLFLHYHLPTHLHTLCSSLYFGFRHICTHLHVHRLHFRGLLTVHLGFVLWFCITLVYMPVTSCWF